MGFIEDHKGNSVRNIIDSFRNIILIKDKKLETEYAKKAALIHLKLMSMSCEFVYYEGYSIRVEHLIDHIENNKF